MSFPDLTPREHEVAALECDAIADYHEKLAGLADGPLAPNLAMQHNVDAFIIRGRAQKHRDKAERLAKGRILHGNSCT